MKNVLTLDRKAYMSALCAGEIRRCDTVWYCLDCGQISTAWDTRHAPLVPEPTNFLDCLNEVIKEAQSAEAA